MRRTLYCIVALALCVCVVGCKAPPSKRSTEFIQPSNMAKHEDLPFHSSWIQEELDLSQFDKIYIAPVNTSYILLDESNWWQNSFKSYSQLKKDVEDVADFTQKTFIKAFKNDPHKRFKVVTKPDETTLVLELAIIELTPNKPYLKLARFAPFGAGAAVTLLNQSNLSTVAFESRMRNGQSGEIVAMFADREQEKKYLLSTKNLTWYSHAKEIIQDWANQFVALTNRKQGEIVKDSATFGLKPW